MFFISYVGDRIVLFNETDFKDLDFDTPCAFLGLSQSGRGLLDVFYFSQEEAVDIFRNRIARLSSVSQFLLSNHESQAGIRASRHRLIDQFLKAVAVFDLDDGTRDFFLLGSFLFEQDEFWCLSTPSLSLSVMSTHGAGTAVRMLLTSIERGLLSRSTLNQLVDGSLSMDDFTRPLFRSLNSKLSWEHAQPAFICLMENLVSHFNSE